MKGFFQELKNSIRAKTAPARIKIAKITNPDYLKENVLRPFSSFWCRMTDLHPKDENDYYSFFGWLISKRLAFLIVIFLGLISFYYVLKVQPLSVFLSDSQGIKTYSYDSLPLRFTEGKVRILGDSDYVAYEGEVRSGSANGTGTLYKKDGAKLYEGEFVNSRYQGNGILYYPSGQVRYQGSFMDNEYQGNGSLYRKNGSLEYVGSFSEGMKDGKGTLYDSGNNEIFTGNFSKDQLLYSDFIGKNTVEVNQIYVGKKIIYMDDTYFVEDMSDIDAVFYGSQKEDNLADEIKIEGVYVLKDTFGYAGEELKTIYDINRFLGEPAYEGNSYVTMPEAVSIHIMNRKDSSFFEDPITDMEQYLSDAVIVNEINDDYGVYLYTYLHDGMRYTFFGKDRNGEFSMYLIEKET